MLISKEEFVKIMDYFKLSNEYVDAINEVNAYFNRHVDFCLGEYFVDYKLESILINVLQTMFNDKDNWIEYWICECECGKNYHADQVIDENGIEIDISTADKLYDFLISNM